MKIPSRHELLMRVKRRRNLRGIGKVETKPMEIKIEEWKRREADMETIRRYAHGHGTLAEQREVFTNQIKPFPRAMHRLDNVLRGIRGSNLRKEKLEKKLERKAREKASGQLDLPL